MNYLRFQPEGGRVRLGEMRMRFNVLGGGPVARVRAVLAAALAAALVAACGSAPEISPAEQPLPKETLDLLGRKGMDPAAPIFVRIFKEESELEIWKARDDGRFYHFKTYPICNWSGDLGPKIEQGDKQAPEGFYTVSQTQMNPNSKFYLAFNLGYPNSYDKSLNRTGQSLMVHGKCKSAGCYAMTDALAEEIYGLAREAFNGGQVSFEAHAFPFRMTHEKLARFKKHKWYPFWASLKQGYDYFELNRVPPSIAVCERRYVVNVLMPAYGRVDPTGRCPAFQRPQLEPFAPRAMEEQIASERITVPGPKTRDSNEVAAMTAREAEAAGFPSAYGMPPGASALGFNQ
jgi:murein L,D-transpeptidase YafK